MSVRPHQHIQAYRLTVYSSSTPLSPHSHLPGPSRLSISLSLPALLCRPDPVAPLLPATLHLRRAGPRRRCGGARARARWHKGTRRRCARGREGLRAAVRREGARQRCGGARGCVRRGIADQLQRRAAASGQRRGGVRRWRAGSQRCRSAVEHRSQVRMHHLHM